LLTWLPHVGGTHMPSFFLLTCCWRPTGEGEAGRGRSRRRSWPPRGPPPLPWASPEEGGWSCSRAGRMRCWAVALKALMLAHLARPRPTPWQLGMAAELAPPNGEEGLWLAQAAEPRADPARGRRKRTARARPPPPLPPPLLQRAGSTAHTPATAAPRSTAFSPRILRPRAPKLLSRWRTPASTPCSGCAAALKP